MPLDVFGGGVVQPAQVSYRAIALSADVTLVWPSFAQTSTDVVARINNVTPTTSGLSITMPDATQVGNGQDALFRNLGSDTFTILDSAGGTMGTVASGEAKYFYLTDNSTSAGSWSVVTFGAGTSSADAATLAGYGLKAIGITLNQKHDVYETSNDLTVATSDRARVFVWTAGTLTCSLPTSSSVGSDFFFIAKNAGSGTISIVPSGADTIDNESQLDLAPNDGVIVYSAGSGNAWYTVAQGRAVSFAFTQLVKNVAGSSNVTLSSAECANKLMTFTGLLTGNINVIVTNTVSVYYVYNTTTGAFTLTVKTAAGTGVGISQGSRDIVVCDATNVDRAITNQAGTTAFDVGSEGAPSITFIGDTSTGFYHPGPGQVAVTDSGKDSMRWNTAASAVNAIDVFPSATGEAVYMTPYGGDSDISIQFRPLGAGKFQITDGSDVTKVISFDASGLTTATTRLWSFPDAASTFVGTTTTQTLTNKTLTQPVITNATNTTQALSDGATVNWNANSGADATWTMGGSRTLAAPSNLKTGGTYTLVITQDGTGGRAVTWNAVFIGIRGAAVPQPNLAANAVTTYKFESPDGTNLYLVGPCTAGPLSVVVVTASGSHNVPTGSTRAKVYIKGAGGGGGGSNTTSYGGGGGEGEERYGWINVVPGVSVTVTLPNGGAGVALNTNSPGTAGGNSTWTDGTATITATGGNGGNGISGGGLGGIGGFPGSGGDYGMPGASGQTGGAATALSNGGGKGGGTRGTNGQVNSGGGGAGGNSGIASSDGAKGLCVVEYWN